LQAQTAARTAFLQAEPAARTAFLQAQPAARTAFLPAQPAARTAFLQAQLTAAPQAAVPLLQSHDASSASQPQPSILASSTVAQVLPQQLSQTALILLILQHQQLQLQLRPQQH
jgi:hypothetical protein